MGSTTSNVAWDGIVLGAALVLFGFFVVLSVIPMSDAPFIAAGGVVFAGAYLMLVRHQGALGLLLAVTGVVALAYLVGLI